MKSCRLCGGSGLQTGDAGSRSDAQAGGHVADQAQLSHGEVFPLGLIFKSSSCSYS